MAEWIKGKLASPSTDINITHSVSNSKPSEAKPSQSEPPNEQPSNVDNSQPEKQPLTPENEEFLSKITEKIYTFDQRFQSRLTASNKILGDLKKFERGYDADVLDQYSFDDNFFENSVKNLDHYFNNMINNIKVMGKTLNGAIKEGLPCDDLKQKLYTAVDDYNNLIRNER